MEGGIAVLSVLVREHFSELEMIAQSSSEWIVSKQARDVYNGSKLVGIFVAP